MTDTIPKFDPIPRLQQIAATIEESGGRVFDCPHTAVHYINCAINEIERLQNERDRARRLVCELQCDPPERFIGLPHEVAQMYGWDCFNVTERRQPDATTDETSQEAP